MRQRQLLQELGIGPHQLDLQRAIDDAHPRQRALRRPRDAGIGARIVPKNVPDVGLPTTKMRRNEAAASSTRTGDPSEKRTPGRMRKR